MRVLGSLSPSVDAIGRLEQQQRAIVEPSEEAFVAKVRGVEHERAQAASHIQEQAEEAAARERDIERMQVHIIQSAQTAVMFTDRSFHHSATHLVCLFIYHTYTYTGM